MKIKHSLIQTSYNYPVHEPYQKEDVLFFDIETTGFSAKTSYVYLIGCMYYKENSWQLTQWLNTEPVKESEFILSFFDFIKNYSRIIHYNGSGFDIPFLQKKAELYGIASVFTHMESIDLYKLILPLRKVFSFESIRLKAIEGYLNLKRMDTYSGEELISLYSAYLGRLAYERLAGKSELNTNSNNPSADELESLLLLHNFEDIKNLLPISDLLYFKDIVGSSSLTNFHPVLTYELNPEQDSILLLCQLPFSFPADFTVHCPLKEKTSLKNNQEVMEDMELAILFSKNTILFNIPIFNGTLKYFLSPPSDYYYLPLEDMAIHKSVSQYVDKEFRKKATPSTCYIKKSGHFIPWIITEGDVPEEPYFKLNYADRITYIEAENLDQMPSKELTLLGESLLSYLKNFYHL